MGLLKPRVTIGDGTLGPRWDRGVGWNVGRTSSTAVDWSRVYTSRPRAKFCASGSSSGFDILARVVMRA